MAEAVVLFEQVVNAALRLPGVRVDRERYLRSSFGKLVDEATLQHAIHASPAEAGITPAVVGRAARASIKWHRLGVSTASAVAGLPGGPALPATIPADLAQYMWHTLVTSQKLAYLHGWPQLVGNDGEFDDETRLMLLSFVGVMFGSEAANQVITKVAQHLAQHVAKELPKKALTKYALYNMAKQVAKMLGVKLTKDVFGKSVAKVVPIIGGAASGGLTWATFSIMANRLHAHLAELPLSERS